MVMPLSKDELNRWAKGQELPGRGLLDYLSRVDELMVANLKMLSDLAAVLMGIPAQGVEVLAQAFGVRMELIISSYNARSTESINPDKLAKCFSAIRVSVIIKNGLDQDVDYAILGNISESYSSALSIATGTVLAGNNGLYQLLFEEWMPYVGVQLTPADVPTTGSVDVIVVIQEPK